MSYKSKIINIVKKSKDKISFIVEEFDEYEHKFGSESNCDSDNYDNISSFEVEKYNEYEHESESESNCGFDKNIFEISKSSIKIHVINENIQTTKIPIIIKRKTDETSISSSFEEELTSYFNLQGCK